MTFKEACQRLQRDLTHTAVFRQCKLSFFFSCSLIKSFGDASPTANAVSELAILAV